jgi:hypothetical protein
MPTEQIKIALKQLHNELDSAESVDPELKLLLHDLDHDIHRLLALVERPPGSDQSLIARIEDAANAIEIEHPQAVGILRRLADALSQIGI